MSEGTRERILRAVLRVIGAEGVAGVTNRRVAKAAGVSLGSITYHFETQRDLQREALLLFVREETERLAALAQAQVGPVSLADAAVIVEQVAESTTFGRDEELAPLELYIQAGRDPDLRDAAADCFAAYDQIARTVLTGLGVADPDRLAGPVVALLAGLQLRRLATGATGGTGIGDALTMLVRGAS
ncbi:TetR/AcrR family transcriptional regulator [Labedaea rhizosphaerae]|uniref:TetR family transcriptional regulator n=1 Tax=Labedaea rhizosphaerae TaxID=598644 RepID=A0A4R6SPZ3_LABRH|nr:TetR/AcrR family transcriptional regulator [Labedaea rhizosphaerae]TDQ05670.1 TetR family transcriptional regulator [Labedaea rhizosphaerae]